MFQMLMVMVGAIDHHCPNSSQSEWKLEVCRADLEEEQENHSEGWEVLDVVLHLISCS